ncbi:ferric reductase like transmembrane component-domain-containing protein [Geopyxis carbonaria]|nr:ferric reductase like transmembrane component-domain-containing protein [Geopyxis carbonaria]
MILGYLVLNLVFMVVNYPAGINVKSVADRAGHLAVVNMPVYFIFSGRNNVLIWFTGWPYKDFQVFHKWIARTAFLCVIVHAAGYGYKSAQKAEMGPRRRYDGRLWWNGIAAMTVMAVLVLFSIHPVRRRSYELFLAVHIICAAIFLMFAFNHVAPSLHPYKRYIWACVAIWSLDRSLRLLRLIVFNRRGRHTARAKIIPGTQTIRFTVYPKIKDVGFVPSAHYFIYIPDRWCFWECHPFTAAGWRPAGPSLTQTPDKLLFALERIKTPADGSNSSNEKDAVILTTTSASRKGPARAKLTFLIHAQRGMTRDILQRIINSPEKSVDVPCFLEGPYGNLRPVHAFPTVVVIAGGVGISTGLPYLQQQLHRRREITHRFLLIWTVREGSLAEKVLREVRGLSFRPDVAVRVYITRSNEKDSWRMPLGVKVRYRRPLIEEMIVKEANSRVPGTPMAVISCGGGAVVDSARRGAVRALDGAAGKKGRGEVVYWEEGYGH